MRIDKFNSVMLSIIILSVFKDAESHSQVRYAEYRYSEFILAWWVSQSTRHAEYRYTEFFFKDDECHSQVCYAEYCYAEFI